MWYTGGMKKSTDLIPVEGIDFPDWQERGWTQEPLFVFVADDEIFGEVEEVAPGVVADESIDRMELFLVLDGLGIRGWWHLRKEFLESGKDYFKFFQVGEDKCPAGSLDADGVPILTVYSRRRINGMKISFWEEPISEGREVEARFVPTLEKPVPLVRCTRISSDGVRCGALSVRGATVCSAHGGALPGVKRHAESVIEAARNELIGAVPMAVDTLVQMTGPGVAEGIRLKAAESILDRAGLKGGYEISVEVGEKVSAVDAINDRFAQILGRGTAQIENVLDVEILEDELDES